MSDNRRWLRSALRIVVGVVGGALLLTFGTAPCVALPFVKAVPPVVALPTIDPALLSSHVHTLTTELHPRSHAQPAKLDAAAAFIRAELGKHGRVEEQTFVVAGNTYRNVIASVGPETNERVVVGAHYDSALGFPGADDNASGVAGLLALAEPLSKAPLHVRVELVAFTLEEPPYFATEDMGSVHHAKRLKEEGAIVRAMLSLEMIGYFSDAPKSQRFPSPLMGLIYPTTGNFITLVARGDDRDLVRKVKASMMGATDLPVRSLNGPAIVQGVDWSDHRSYWAEGYTALMVTDTSFLRNVRYHTAADTPETLDYPRMAKVVQGTFAAVVALAQ
ncbi:MAG: M28 family peptidase [Polyangiales bacterium]